MLVEHMSECGPLHRILNAKRWRGEKLTLSEFREQLRRLAVTLEMVVVNSAGHYQAEPRDLFKLLGRPGVWNSEEEVRERLILLARAKEEDSDEYLIKSVDGQNPANIFARANKVRKRRERDKKVVGEGQALRVSGHRKAEPEVEQREVAAITTAVSPGEKTPKVQITENALEEDTHEATECDSPLPNPKILVMDTGAEISVVNDEDILENVCKGNKMALRTINGESVVDTYGDLQLPILHVLTVPWRMPELGNTRRRRTRNDRGKECMRMWWT